MKQEKFCPHLKKRCPEPPIANLPSRLAYLIDASALVPFYRHHQDLEPKINHLIEQRGLDRATLFIPNFCIAEIFNTFAKLRYRESQIDDTEYNKIKEIFRSHIRHATLFYEYPLHIYHIYNVDYISPFEHQWYIGEKRDWFLSAFDILIIGMGIELIKKYGDENFRIITCDERISKICEQLRKAGMEVKKKYQVPEHLIYPQSINLLKCNIRQLPVVKGQKL